jgi:N-acetylglucosaminyldiphosphoundecaprenol N-acetyl-beta-D-mannosaminyltransferase
METHDSPVHASDAPANDLARDVYCILGLPIDALDMPTVLRRIDVAAASRNPFFISTPNLNFLVNSRSDAEFRESVLNSDLCPADGMPIVWIARLIGVPIKERVSGSDIFEVLKASHRCERTLRAFLFGGEEGVAAAAASVLNAAPVGLSCKGTLNPGFGTIDDMSRDEVVDAVNASGADLLVVSLGAKKGQLWLHRNHKRLTIPVRVHLGAVINFQAGTVKRAPLWLRACGLEWLWRIKEEPYMWRRYAHDGFVLLRLVVTRALPLAALNRWHRLKSARQPQELLISMEQHHDSVTVRLCGNASQPNISKAITCFQEILTKGNTDLVVDLASARVIDQRFLGLLLMVRKHLNGQGAKLGFVGVSPAMRRLFWLNQLDFMLNSAIERVPQRLARKVRCDRAIHELSRLRAYSESRTSRLK